MELVEYRKNGVYTSSSVVAKKFGYQHYSLAKTIKKLRAKLIEKAPITGGGFSPPEVFEEQQEKKGQQFTAFLMNREFFSLLVMRLRGDKAFEWQLKFNGAFYAMERKLLQLSVNSDNPKWIEARLQGKLARRQETDVIKDFVDYAISQGSSSASYYYKHFTNSTYKALGLIADKKPKLRDTMNMFQTSELLLAEQLVKDLLVKYMKLGRHYKDIYQSIKEDLTKFAEGLHMGQIEQ